MYTGLKRAGTARVGKCAAPACGKPFRLVMFLGRQKTEWPCPNRRYCSKRCANAVRIETYWRNKLGVKKRAA